MWFDRPGESSPEKDYYKETAVCHVVISFAIRNKTNPRLGLLLLLSEILGCIELLCK